MIVIADLLDAARCAQLIAMLDARGFAPTGEHYPGDYRNNDRLVFDDDSLASALFEQLRDRLPAELVVDGVHWQLVGLNRRFRACRYRDGQAFCIHRDGPHVPSDDVRSHLTVQLYLDEPSAGGRTRFYADARGEQLVAAIEPRRGTAIVFPHHDWHDGEAVTAGVKHVLRTDAMYRRVDPVRVDEGIIGRHRGYAWRVIACRDGRVASAGRDGTVRVWTCPPRVIDLHAGSVTTLVEAHDGRLWCGTRSGAIAVDGEIVDRGVGAVLGAAATPDGIVFSTSRGELRIYSPTRTDVRRMHWHDGWVWSVATRGSTIASCGEDGHVVVDGDVVAVLATPLRAIAFSCARLLVGDRAGGLHVIGGGSFRAHDGAITGLAVAPDGTIATSSEDGTIKRWRDGQRVATHAARDFVTSVACEPTGDLVCSGYEGTIWRISARTSS